MTRNKCILKIIDTLPLENIVKEATYKKESQEYNGIRFSFFLSGSLTLTLTAKLSYLSVTSAEPLRVIESLVRQDICRYANYSGLKLGNSLVSFKEGLGKDSFFFYA